MPWDRMNAPLLDNEAFTRRVRTIADDMAIEFMHLCSQPDADPEAFLERVRADLDRIHEVSGRDEAAARGLQLFLDEVAFDPISGEREEIAAPAG